MRRALLVIGALAVPLGAAAQIDAQNGQLLDFENFSTAPEWQPTGASFINKAMCDGEKSPQLEWNLGQTPPANSQSYQLYASNKVPAASGTSTIVLCATENDVNASPATRAAQIGSGTQDTAVERNTTLDGAAAVAAAGLACDDASELREFYICAHLLSGSTPTLSASGKFVVQRRSPAAPTNVRAGPGPSLLDVSWTASTGGAAPVDHYVAAATPVDDQDNPLQGATAITSGEVNGTSTKISGLTNGQRYRVVVQAFSVGDNPSGDSNVEFATPTDVNDFWDVYTAAGGGEKGGCGAGAAGPVALLAVAGLLATLRRRK